MLLVLADRGDWRGPFLCERWASADARLMTPDDLQRPGWRYQPARPLEGVAVAGAEPLAVALITGVCTLLPCVVASELPSIRTEERGYAAAEMTAFLCAWLSALPCPVVNPATPACLCGPAWSPLRWLRFASEASLPIVSEPPDWTLAVTVVGSRAFGAQSAGQRDLAIQLANRAGVPLLRVLLDGSSTAPAVAGADLWIDPSLDGVSDAIAEEMETR
jgi:hypothetical protein